LAVETNYPTSPDISSAIFGAGWLSYTNDQYPQAITEFDKLLTGHPVTSEAAKASFYISGLGTYAKRELQGRFGSF
jgi:outer membrane protein assembly factor BamD (BamD/ComL family)